MCQNNQAGKPFNLHKDLLCSIQVDPTGFLGLIPFSLAWQGLIFALKLSPFFQKFITSHGFFSPYDYDSELGSCHLKITAK